MFETRHKFELALVIILAFIAFLTNGLAYQWIVIASLAFVLFLFDLIFLTQEEFANSPNYGYWKQLEESKLHELDSDVSAKNKKMLFSN